MINLNDIQVFVSTARIGTINAAAKNLDVPPSTVSRALTRLEKQVKIQLLRRTAHGILLTDAGRDYLEQCQSALSQLEEANEMLDSHRAKPHGTLRLGVPSVFARKFLAPTLKHFVAEFPEIRIQIMCHDHDDSVFEVLGNEMDFLFQIGKPEDSSLKIKTFPPVLQNIYASPTYVEKYGLPAEPADLLEHSCIGYAKKDLAIWNLKKEKQKKSVKLALHISVSDPFIRRQFAVDGLGIGQLPEWVALTEVEAGKLIPVLPGWQSEPLHFHALYAERSKMTPKIKVFIEFIERFTATEHDPRRSHFQPSDIFQIT
jgi:DNA-binding transcriptional LysR family regulator